VSNTIPKNNVYRIKLGCILKWDLSIKQISKFCPRRESSLSHKISDKYLFSISQSRFTILKILPQTIIGLFLCP